MNKYARQPDAVIDLHGHTTNEAGTILDTLFSEAHTHVRIIVGKGNRSKDGPILPNFVKHYLNSRDIDFSQSKLMDGGEGALEAYPSTP